MQVVFQFGACLVVNHAVQVIGKLLQKLRAFHSWVNSGSIFFQKTYSNDHATATVRAADVILQQVHSIRARRLFLPSKVLLPHATRTPYVYCAAAPEWSCPGFP